MRYGLSGSSRAEESHMSQEQAREAKCRTSILEKAAYSRASQKRLSNARAKLLRIKAAIRSATFAGHIVMSRQLDDAQRAVDANLAAAEASLEQLRKSSDESWKELSVDVDTAWENLSQSIIRLVSGYSESKR